MKNYNIIVFILIAVVFAACDSTDPREELKKELEEQQRLAKEIEREISKIADRLATLDDGADSRYFEPVRIEYAEPVMFRHFFEAGGTVEAVSEAFISPEINGQIKEVYVKEGDFVEKGQVLARLNTEVSEKSIAELETALRLAMDIYKRQKRLWEDRIGSELQYLEARNNKETLERRLATSRAQLDMATIISPIDGLVEQVNQKKGEMASPGMGMMYLVNMDQMYVKADVSERFLPALNTGDEVVLRIPSYPDYNETIPIERIGNVVNRGNRTFVVQLRVQNPHRKLKPNMIAVLEINDYSAENSIVISSRLIKEDLNGKYIYVAVTDENGDKLARKRYVVPGRTYKDKTRIDEGLNPGDAVITDGFNRVSDGSLLRIV